MSNFKSPLLEYSQKLRSKLKLTVFNPRLTSCTGSDKNTILLLQLHYWLQVKGTNLDLSVRTDKKLSAERTTAKARETWYLSTLDQWKVNFPNWSPSSIRNGLISLEKLGLIKSCQPYVSKGNRVKAYTIVLDRFITLLEEVQKQEFKTFSASQLELFENVSISEQELSVSNDLNKSSSLLDTVLKYNYNAKLARRIGGDKNCIILLQLHYWITKCGKNASDSTKKGLWIYNSLDSWSAQFNWSVNTLHKCFQDLVSQNLISTKKVYKKCGDHTKWYSINLELFNKLLLQVLEEEGEKMLGYKKEKMFFGRLKSTAIQASSRCVKNCEIEPLKIVKSYKSKTKSIKTKNLSIEMNNFIKACSLDSEQLSIAKSMIETWNEIMPSSMRVGTNTKRLGEVYKLYKTHFKGLLGNWRQYCIDINSSKFLMGEKKKEFKAYFDWIIKENQIERVKAKEFGIGDRTPDLLAKEQRLQSSLRSIKMREQERALIAERRSEAEQRKNKKNVYSTFIKSLATIEFDGIKREFEQFILSSNSGEKFNFVRKQFNIKKWDAIGINIFFEEYIFDNYIDKQKCQLFSNAFLNQETRANV